jgi:NADH-quinone oxidoreductase subunit H
VLLVGAGFLLGFGVAFLVIAGIFLLPFVQSWLLPLFWFVAKTGTILFAFMWIRGTLPRFRYDQLMAFTWKFLFPVAMLNLLVTAFLVAWRAQ